MGRNTDSARTTGFVRPGLQTKDIDVCVLLGFEGSTVRKVSAITDSLFLNCKFYKKVRCEEISVNANLVAMALQ